MLMDLPEGQVCPKKLPLLIIWHTFIGMLVILQRNTDLGEMSA
jgi:hypothetical protein